MVDFIGAVRDPQFRQDVGQGLVDAAGRGLAMIGGAPVDLTTMFLRPLGYSVPDEQIIGSSEYIGRQMADMGLISQARNPVAEFLSALLIPDPTDIQKLAPVVERAIVKGAQNLAAPRTLNRQAGQIGVVPTPRPQAQREEALRIAQENAAKPVSEGGLGLPPDNTAMDRAKAMGFDVDSILLHGTENRFDEFLPGKSGVFLTENSSVAEQFGDVSDFYVNKGKTLKIKQSGLDDEQVKLFDKIQSDLFDEDEIDDLFQGEDLAEIMQYGNAYHYLGRANQDRILREIKKAGYDSVEMPDFHGAGDEIVTVVFNPKNIRSVDAAFDPVRINDRYLLGAADPRLLTLLGLGSGAGLYGLGELYRQEQDNR